MIQNKAGEFVCTIKTRAPAFRFNTYNSYMSALAYTDSEMELNRILFVVFRTEICTLRDPACFRSLFQCPLRRKQAVKWNHSNMLF